MSTTPNFADEPTGASIAFASTDPTLTKARAMLQSGKFISAEGLLSTGKQTDSPETIRARLELLDIIQRIRWEYSLDADALLAKVKTTIPDATTNEVGPLGKGKRRTAQDDRREKVFLPSRASKHLPFFR